MLMWCHHVPTAGITTVHTTKTLVIVDGGPSGRQYAYICRELLTMVQPAPLL